mmetsp:Transcript_180503/g.572724  ORF Transcript_180503/g.572724 Transcript_180503/m.572724 type:complete len:92 (-) Transcript_180503:164-439(-)
MAPPRASGPCVLCHERPPLCASRLRLTVTWEVVFLFRLNSLARWCHAAALCLAAMGLSFSLVRRRALEVHGEFTVVAVAADGTKHIIGYRA